MFPGMGGLDPRMMKQAMKRMGIKQDDLDASQVIVKLKNSQLVFDNPEISKIDMSGNVSFQLSGEFREESLDKSVEINEEDIETVVLQTGCSKEKAIETIKETNGDLAEAIMKLSE